jgi:hypothetical protein
MLEDAVKMFDFLEKTLGFPQNNIFIFGRSIGTGPASYLASKRPNAKMLILLSPYTNLKAVANDFVGFLSIFFKDRFNNLKCMETVNCPLIIIHGKQDNIIKVCHSDKLYEKCETRFKRLIQPRMMNHNHFKLYEDLLNPIFFFLERINKELGINENNRKVPDSIGLEILQLYKSSTIYQQELELEEKKKKKKHFSSSISSIKNKTKPVTKRKNENPKPSKPRRNIHLNNSKLKKKIDIFSNKRPSKPSPNNNEEPVMDNFEFPKHKRLNEFGTDPFA